MNESPRTLRDLDPTAWDRASLGGLMGALASGRSCTDGRALVMLTWFLAGMTLVVACGGDSVGSGANPPDLIEAQGGSPVEIDVPGGSRPTDTQQGGSAGAAAGGAISMGGEQAGGAISMGGEQAGGAISVGGAAVGGVASGGAPGGTAGAPAIAPEGCDLSNEFNRADNCALEATCGFDYYAIECIEAEAGEWQCGCHAKPTAEYRVATTSPAVACSAAMRACSGTDPTFEEAPEDCEQSQSAGSDDCELTEACSRPMDLGPGQSPVLTETRRYSCEKVGSGVVECDCANGVTSEQLEGVDPSEGCGLARAYCESQTRTPAGTPSCTPGFLAQEADFCQVGEVCSTPVLLDDGSVVRTISNESVSCSAKDGRSSCVCGGDRGGYFWFSSTDTPTLETCSSLNELCTRTAEIERHGAYECETTSETANAILCSTVLRCRQPAKFEDIEIELAGPLSIVCSPDTHGSWSCSCLSQNVTGSVVEAASVPVEATTGWDACSAAVAPCQESIDIVFEGAPT